MDLGTGTGQTLSQMMLARNVIMCDSSPHMLKQAVGKLPFRAVICDASYSLPFKNELFDFVSAVGLFEYVADANLLLAEILRILEFNGFALVTHSPANIFSILRVLNGSKIHVTSKGEFEKSIKTAGFKIIDFRKTLMQFQWLIQKQI